MKLRAGLEKYARGSGTGTPYNRPLQNAAILVTMRYEDLFCVEISFLGFPFGHFFWGGLIKVPCRYVKAIQFL